MVQSLGISVGNLNSYVAAGQGGGIEILLNDYSSRATPTMVAFTEKNRYMGVDASSNMFSNLKNTIYDLMLLLGKSYKHIPANNYLFKLEEANDGQPLVVVKYLGEEKKFSITQVLAMLFTKLRSFAYDATDCVISCPQFYNEYQKAALLEAALTAGLNPLQLISDMSAVVLNYVYYRTNNKENTDKFITFVNFGQSSLQTCVAWLKPSKNIVKILVTESEPIGGRDFDHVLADYFVNEYNLKLTPKAHLKLVAACEKLKKLLSSNSNEIPIHVESLISEDQDFTARIDRAKFEALSQNFLEQVEACLKRTLRGYQEAITEITKPKPKKPTKRVPTEEASPEDTEMAADSTVDSSSSEQQMDTTNEASTQPDNQADENDSTPAQPPAASEESDKKEKKEKKVNKSKKEEEADDIPKDFSLGVEIVGGSTRIPAVKQLIQQVFQVVPSTTLNTDEAVVRGCVLHCATLHPGIKVNRQVRIIGSESFMNKGSLSCDKEARRVELELILNDKKYKSRTEARNNLEEYIYSERSKLQEGDQFLQELTTILDWLCTEEGEDATEEEYLDRLHALKKGSQSKLLDNKSGEIDVVTSSNNDSNENNNTINDQQ